MISARKTLFLSFVVAVAAGCCPRIFVAGPGGTPAPSPTTPQYEVGVVDLPDDVVDPARNREIPLRVFYPIAMSGPAPVVIVSHGGKGHPLAHQVAVQYLGRALATAGYVSIHPNHTSSLPRIDRPLDDRYLIDVIDAGTLTVPGFQGTLDASRIGVAGHSWGSYTALVVGGATTNLGSSEDPRVDAVVGLSPQGAGQFGFTEGSWSQMTKPTYTIFGSAEADGSQDDGYIAPMWRRQPYDGMPPGDKFVSIVPDAVHNDFSHGTRPIALTAQAFVNANAVAFFDTYLRGETSLKCQIGCLAAPEGTVTMRK